MQNKFAYTVFFFLFFLLTTCSKVPDHIISEKKMQEVITDMHVAESVITSDNKRFNNDSIKKVVFNSVFAKHHITQADYDSSLVWYAKNLDIYLKILDRAKIDIEERIKDLGDVQANASPSSNQDSINIWPRRTSLELKPNALFNGMVFYIDPDVDYSSGSSFVLGMKVWGLKANRTHFPEIRMNVDQGDTIFTINKKIESDGYHEVILKSMPTRRVKRVYGFIRLDNADKDYYKVYVDSLNLMKFNYGSGPTSTLKKDTIQ